MSPRVQVPEHERRETDPLVIDLIDRLIETNTSLSTLDIKMSSTLAALDVKVTGVDTLVTNHISEETAEIILIKDEFTALRTSIQEDMKNIQGLLEELKPLIIQNKEKAIAWNWITKTIPEYLEPVYKALRFLAVLGVGSWAFIEFIVHNKLGK